jgi:hypothetical protein
MSEQIIKGIVYKGSIADRITIRMVLNDRIHEGEITLTDEAMREVHTATEAGDDPVETLVRMLQR